MAKRIGIVGAGVGGLATAARLSFQGQDVSVFEKLDRPGGRANIIEDRGFRFDTGPSFVLMPDFFQEVFVSCGEDIGDYLDLKVLDKSYKIFFSDGRSLTVYRDRRKTAEEFERLQKGAGNGFERFIDETRRIYQATRPLLYRSFSPGDILDPAMFQLGLKIRIFQTYGQLARKFISDESLVFALTFEAMFMGVSPFEAPAFYSIISYADHIQKIFHPMGGMYQIPLALERLAKKFGARMHYQMPVDSIFKKNGRLVLGFGKDGQEFDKVVVNADYAAAQKNLLKRRMPSYRYSCSVYLLYLGLKKKIKNLEHHNLFFAKDLKINLKQIFKSKDLPQDPSFYVHVPTVTDASLAPAEKDIVYILIPVRNLQGVSEDLGPDDEKRLKSQVYGLLNRITGENIEDLIETEHVFYPRDFIERYNIAHGATFGLAHTLFQSAFFRPSNADRILPGLFYAGASTQPGGGLPPVLASSKIASDLVSKT